MNPLHIVLLIEARLRSVGHLRQVRKASGASEFSAGACFTRRLLVQDVAKKVPWMRAELARAMREARTEEASRCRPRARV